MSLSTWKLEFYPVNADNVEKDDAIAHSIKKWEGLTDENFTKFKLVRKSSDIKDLRSGEVFPIIALTAAAWAVPSHAIRYCCTHAVTPWYASILGLILSE